MVDGKNTYNIHYLEYQNKLQKEFFQINTTDITLYYIISMIKVLLLALQIISICSTLPQYNISLEYARR